MEELSSLVIKFGNGQEVLTSMVRKIMCRQVDQSDSLVSLIGSSPSRHHSSSSTSFVEETTAAVEPITAVDDGSAGPLISQKPRTYLPRYDAQSIAGVTVADALQAWNTHGLMHDRFTPHTPGESKSKIKKVVKYALSVVDRPIKDILKSDPPDNLLNPLAHTAWAESLRAAANTAEKAVLAALLLLEQHETYTTHAQKTKEEKDKKKGIQTNTKKRKALEKGSSVSAIDRRISTLTTLKLINDKMFK